MKRAHDVEEERTKRRETISKKNEKGGEKERDGKGTTRREKRTRGRSNAHA